MKKIVTLILLMCIVLSLVACADKGNTTTESTTTESSMLESSTLESSLPENSTLESSVPEASVPESSAPESSTPESSKPVSSKPESSKPVSSKPESSKPESSKPESSKPESSEPENSKPEDTAPVITLQEVYDAGKNLVALLGDHESVHALVTVNGKFIREEYLSKQYCYAFDDAEYMDFGYDYAHLVTDHSLYTYFDGEYTYGVSLRPTGMVDPKETFDTALTSPFVSESMLNDAYVITEKDGYIIVACTSGMDDILIMDENIVSCVETYTIDAKTREITSVKTAYTYKDGTVDEGIVTITRNAEIPERMKPLLAFEQETENLRTVTIVSNPGTEHEKTESVKLPKGISVGLSIDWDVEQTFTAYTDAQCTQPFEGEPDVNSDATIYIKWTA